MAFDLLVALVVGLIGWEVADVCARTRYALDCRRRRGRSRALLAAVFLPASAAVAGLVAVALLAAGASGAGSDRVRIGLYLARILVADWGFAQLRETVSPGCSG
ncbi:MAG: hypothetical protein R3D59_17720 [Paracoccaceae bacterium]